MVEKISPLGRGVNALFSKIKSNSFATLEINQIFPNPFQPRTNFNESELKELAKSISEYGVIQPLTVRKIKENKYQIISGERRYRACKIATVTKIPVYIKETKDNKMLELALIENIQLTQQHMYKFSFQTGFGDYYTTWSKISSDSIENNNAFYGKHVIIFFFFNPFT